MFVPSLSWQNDAFYIKTAQKWRFFTEVVPRARAEVREAQRQENRLADRESRKDLLEVLRVTLILCFLNAAVFWLS